MRASIVIAAHNEGHFLERTIASCLESLLGFDAEIVIADDASSDGSVEEARRRFPQVSLFRHRRRRGTSSAKDLGARKAHGEVLVFLDAHCKPEAWAIERLVNDVETFEGSVVVTPRIPNLDPEAWACKDDQTGYGYGLDLERFHCEWLQLGHMQMREGYYETPALCGCCFAVSRALYFKLRGFDRHMVDWGVEDLDFSLKAWLLGEGILHNPYACIGHRFRTDSPDYSISDLAVPVNQLRTARKALGDRAWEEWLHRFRLRLGERRWQEAWAGFLRGRRSAERERKYLLRARKRDEYWYAARFGLSWPAL
jgi:glycosyltransferase involved in cell wall biosynthesis